MDVQLAEAINQFLTNVVWPVLGTVILFGVHSILNKVSKKFNVQLTDAQRASIDNAAMSAIAFAEEQAAARIKQGATKMSSDNKMHVAASQVLKAFPKLSRNDAQEIVEGIIGRTKGVGATGANSVAPSAPN